MKCDHARELLQELMDGPVPPLDRAGVLAHLATCSPCRLEHARATALVRSLDRLADPEVPSHFSDQVMRQLPEMLPAREGAGHVVRWGLAAAAAVAAFALSLFALPDAAGPSVARGAIGPISASLRLGGEIATALAEGAAATLDACSAALATAGVGPKLGFAVLLVLCNGGLAVALRRYRALGATSARRGRP